MQKKGIFLNKLKFKEDNIRQLISEKKGAHIAYVEYYIHKKENIFRANNIICLKRKQTVLSWNIKCLKKRKHRLRT